jgi:hypothetical protein
LAIPALVRQPKKRKPGIDFFKNFVQIPFAHDVTNEIFGSGPPSIFRLAKTRPENGRVRCEYRISVRLRNTTGYALSLMNPLGKH